MKDRLSVNDERSGLNHTLEGGFPPVGRTVGAYLLASSVLTLFRTVSGTVVVTK
jgi:Holliday junction resolvasome RuvABC ATP-dependent DNA helicase subunit